MINTILCFGDSFCDSNLGRIRTNDGSQIPPTRTHDGKVVYNDGRCTDKYTWPEMLAQSFGLRLVNYAIGGSTTGIPKATGRPRPSLRDQMKAFLGETTTIGICPRGRSQIWDLNPATTLVIMAWSGPNDFTFRGTTSIRRTVALAKSNLLMSIETLKAKNFRNILLTTPIRCSYAITMAGLETSANEYADSMRKMMLDLAKLSNHRSVIIADFHVLAKQMDTNPTAFGFQKDTMYKPFVTGLLLGDGGVYHKIENSQHTTSRPRFCYDALHPTHWVHERFAHCCAQAIQQSSLASSWPQPHRALRQRNSQTRTLE